MTTHKSLLGLGVGALAGYLLTQQVFAMKWLRDAQAVKTLAGHTNLAAKGQYVLQEQETETYTRTHTIEDGIERIVCTPKKRRFETPILMQHGMWHGAWTWWLWQPLFAEWGWETHAHSLPGHSGSPMQRPIARCTLDYYLGFLKAEVERLPRKPVLMGHSMGGALAQWYLKYVGDDLPAVVLVAPWNSHDLMGDNFLRVLRLDPIGCMMVPFTWDAWPLMRTPEAAARALLSPQAAISPAEFQARLCRESTLVMMQHRPPFWTPPTHVKTPMLLYAGEIDAVIELETLRRSAQFYGADFMVAEAAGHNLMMAHNYYLTAEQIYQWLAANCEGLQ